MDHWTEVHTAFCVAKFGTVSKAADTLGVHRATVNRHIDVLEAGIGAKLFLRHRRGYELTDTGKEFLAAADRAHDALDAFFGRVRMQAANAGGEIVVTTLYPLTEMILPGVFEFRRRYPRTQVSLHAGDNLAKLEKAEAHVALRVGSKPTHDDYVVQPFCTLDFTLFAHQSYIDRHGKPDFEDLSGHFFVGNPDPNSRAPFEAWMGRNLSLDQVVLRSSAAKILEAALLNGEGMAFMPARHAKQFRDLVAITPPKRSWRVQSWLVTHMDVHRSEKIQAMLACLKAVTQQG